MTNLSTPYLPEGLPIPVPEPDGLSAPFWDGLREGRLRVQRCSACGTWQFAPEWICHHCHRFHPDWVEVVSEGRIYSWQRVWHPAHPALRDHGPYLAVLVELHHCGGVRLVGNLLGDTRQEPRIGDEVIGVFEHHLTANQPYSLLQWTLRRPA